MDEFWNNTGLLFSMSSSRQQGEVLFLYPIYHQKAPTNTVEERRANLSGFVAAKIQVGESIERTLVRKIPAGVDMWVYDDAAPSQSRLVYFHSMRTNGPDAGGLAEESFPLTTLLHTKTFNFGGRPWRVVCAGIPETYLPHKWTAWGAFITGLVATMLLVVYLFGSITKTDQIRRQAAQLQELAATDGLTRLWNWRHFREALDREHHLAQRRKSNLALVMLDVDHFKAFNDTYGHDFGDRVLVGVAGLLRSEARTTDIVARYGGEEFVILMPDATTSAAFTAAERIRERIASHTVTENKNSVPLKVSLGVASIRGGDGVSTDDLVRRADAAMYAAKRAGRNCTKTWEPSLAERSTSLETPT